MTSTTMKKMRGEVFIQHLRSIFRWLFVVSYALFFTNGSDKVGLIYEKYVPISKIELIQ